MTTKIVIKGFKTVNTVFDFDDLHVETGIITDNTHYQANPTKKRKLGTIQVRGRSNKLSKKSMVQIMEKVDNQFKILSNPAVINPRRIIDAIMQDLIGDWLYNHNKKNRVINGWTAFFRQPMMAGKYKNSKATAKIKGFNKGGIDTGQLYQAIDGLIVKDNEIWSLKDNGE